MMKKTGTRLFAFLLCLAMCVSLMPASVLAADADETEGPDFSTAVEEPAETESAPAASAEESGEPAAEAEPAAEQTVISDAALEDEGEEEDEGNTSFETALPIAVNETVTVKITTEGQERFYKITPTADGFYTFRVSFGSTKYYTRSALAVFNEDAGDMDDDYPLMEADSSESTEECGIVAATYSLQAGETYYFRTGLDSESDEDMDTESVTDDEGYFVTLTMESCSVDGSCVDGVLTVSGEGPMLNYQSAADTPWADYADDITSVVIADGVTSIGAYAFSCLNNLKTVTVGTDVEKICRYAFDGSGGMELFSVTFTGNMPEFAVVENGMEGEEPFGVFSEDKVVIYYPTDNSTWLEEEGRNNASANATVYWNGNAASGKCGADGDNLTWSLSADGVLTITGSGAMADYEYVPDEEEGMNDYYTTPWYDDTVSEVILPEGLTRIGAYAFIDSDLKSVAVPSTVTSIGIEAFGRCESLDTVTFTGKMPEFETDYNTGYSVFDEDSLTIVYPEDDTSWQDSEKRADAETNAEITWGDQILDWSLEDGVLTVQSGVIPDYDDTSAAPWADDAETVKKLVVGEKVTAIGARAFDDLENLETVTIGDGVKTIGAYAFSGLENLKTVTIGHSIESIGSEAFAWCPSLASVTFTGRAPEFTVVVDEGTEEDDPAEEYGVFQDDTLTIQYTRTYYSWVSGNARNQAAIGAVVSWKTVIPASSDRRVSSVVLTLPDVYYSYDLPEKGDVTVGYGSCTVDSLTWYQPDDMGDWDEVGGVADTGTFLAAITLKANDGYFFPDYPVEVCFSGRKVIAYFSVNDDGSLEADYEMEAQDAPGGNCGVKTEEDPDGESVTWAYINGKLVISCDDEYPMADFTVNTVPWKLYASRVTSVELPEHLTHIGDYAFRVCGNVKSVKIPDSVTSIGKCAFLSCNSLTEITVPVNVETIGTEAFSDCSTLQTVTFLGDSITDFGDNMFKDLTITVYYSGSDAWTGKTLDYGGETVKWVAVQRGDVNDDGSVNLLDLLTLKKALANDDIMALNRIGANVNGDGSINLLDMLQLKQQLLTGSSASES